MSKTEKPTSWRDVVNIHAAADLFPMMSPDELKVLGEDIKRNGMTAPIVWWTEREADIEKTPPPKYQLLDGRNRLDAMECTVEHRPHQFGHPGIDDDKRFAIGMIFHVNDSRQQHAGRRDDVATRLQHDRQP